MAQEASSRAKIDRARQKFFVRMLCPARACKRIHT